jgi:UDP-N-acetylmuramate dehydrogenase
MIGGRADYFFAVRTEQELLAGLRFAREHSLPYYVVGAGTNMLFADAGFRGLILKIDIQGIEKGAGGRISVLSGTPLSDLVNFTLEEGYEGLEFAAGIPGTVGGAVFGNAGAWGSCIADRLEEAVLLDREGAAVAVGNRDLRFGYRQSILKVSHRTVLRSVFRLKTGDRSLIREKIQENLGKRKSPYPSPKMAYAGSFFKNPIMPDGTKVAAGYLLEKVGAKNLRVGGAAVYSGHANFIINRGRARAEDVLRLADEMKTRVKKEFGITLVEEVIYLPADFSMP